MFAFMQAADVSKAKGGMPILIDDVLREAKQEAEKIVKSLDP
jgi:hypothetical protein